MSDPDRLQTVEIKLAHLEHALNEISDVVIGQQRELGELRAWQQRLVQRLLSLEGQSGSASGDEFEKPPHY
jgi:uncharacterized coiled-coil protein SlyX